MAVPHREEHTTTTQNGPTPGIKLANLLAVSPCHKTSQNIRLDKSVFPNNSVLGTVLQHPWAIVCPSIIEGNGRLEKHDRHSEMPSVDQWPSDFCSVFQLKINFRKKKWVLFCTAGRDRDFFCTCMEGPIHVLYLLRYSALNIQIKYLKYSISIKTTPHVAF